MELNELGSYFDHTLLKPDSVRDQIVKLCQEAIGYRFYSVCVPPYYIPLAKQLLGNEQVRTCSVVGFPLGYSSSSAKLAEAKYLLQLGTEELDMVINLSALRNQEWTYIKEELKKINELVLGKKAVLKVIVETCMLSLDEITKLCEVANQVQPHFIKTSTGFNGPGANVEVVSLLRKLLHPSIKIKASGGIRTLEKTLDLIKAGADRIGASESVSIINEARQILKT